MQAALPIGSPVALNVYGVTAALLIGIAILPFQKPFEIKSVSISEIQTKEANYIQNINDDGEEALEPLPKELIPAEKPAVSRQELVDYTRTWIGVPYLWGGESRTGIDCSALVQKVFAKHGIDLPRTAQEQFRKGEGVALTYLLPGDLVFFSTNGPGASHVGIYLGDGDFVSATRRQVEIQNLNQAYWRKAYRGSRRILT